MNMLCVTAVLWAAGSAVAVPPPLMAFQGTGTLPGFGSSSMIGVSGDGSVAVGQVSDGINTLPVLWTLGGGLHSLGKIPGSSGHAARAASFDGSVIVGQSGQRAFRWTQDTGMVDLGTFADDNLGFASAWGVSDDGSTVVGTAATNSGFDVFRWKVGVGLQNEGYFDGGGIASGGNAFVATDIRPGGGLVGLRVKDGEGATDLGVISGLYNITAPHAITADASRVVGDCYFSNTPDAQGEAFLWVEGEGIRSLGDLGGGGMVSRANDISDDGRVIVGSGTDLQGRQGVVWIDGGVALRAHDFLLGLGISGLEGWRLTDVSAVSPDGLTLVGTGINADGIAEGWVARIPSPSSGVVLVIGTLLVRRRRR